MTKQKNISTPFCIRLQYKMHFVICFALAAFTVTVAEGTNIPTRLFDRSSRAKTKGDVWQSNEPRTGCTCIHYVCHCCTNAKLPSVLRNEKVCLRIGYTPKQYEMDFNLFFGDLELLNRTAPVDSLPSECFGSEKIADVCVQVFDVKASEKFFSACSRLFLKLATYVKIVVPLGCFNMKPEIAVLRPRIGKIVETTGAVPRRQGMTDLLPALNIIRSLKQDSGACKCIGVECGCCEHFDIPRIKLNDTACINITYLPGDYGFSVTFSINGRVYINETVSARNPPPICFGIPYLEKEASICLKFYDLNYTDYDLTGCVRLQAKVLHVKVKQIDIGCFNLPLARKTQVEASHWIPLVEAKQIDDPKKKENVRELFRKGVP